jgi:hypothetical protein
MPPTHQAWEARDQIRSISARRAAATVSTATTTAATIAVFLRFVNAQLAAFELLAVEGLHGA